MSHTGTATTMDNASLYRLMTWLSPSYPVGAFAYSHGVEWAVEDGMVTSGESLSDWIETVVSDGSGWTDAVAFSLAYDSSGETKSLQQLNELLLALSPGQERLSETVSLGNAFMKATCDAWAWPGAQELRDTLSPSIVYPVAVASASAGHGIEKQAALVAFQHGVVSNLVSAGMRLIPLGQTAGQTVMSRLERVITETAEKALDAGWGELGGSAVLSDIASMKHETQYTRLFRT